VPNLQQRKSWRRSLVGGSCRVPTSTVEAAFRREMAALESECQHLGDWHTRLEGRMKAVASHAARVRSELKADQVSYRANLRKVFDRELAVTGREKALERREAAIA
jgi:hypothetical protein